MSDTLTPLGQRGHCHTTRRGRPLSSRSGRCFRALVAAPLLLCAVCGYGFHGHSFTTLPGACEKLSRVDEVATTIRRAPSASRSGVEARGLPRPRRRSSRASERSTARQVLPEVSFLLANNLPTPTVTSIAFNVVTFLPQYLWILMVFAPEWSVTRRIMEPLWPVLIFALVHLFIVLSVASTNDTNVEDFTNLALVFNPSVNLNFFSDFGPQDAMMKLMASPGFVSEEWGHVLTWDLFAGRWVYLDGQRRGIFASHSVLLCNLIGPPGLLCHAITCLISGKGLPVDSAEPLVQEK